MTTIELLDVFVMGHPRPRSSAKTWRRVKGIKEWMRTVAWTAKSHLVGVKPTDSPISLYLTFYSVAQGDATNYAKAVEDALTKILYTDDRQVLEIHAKLVRSFATPGVQITAYEIVDPNPYPIRGGP